MKTNSKEYPTIQRLQGVIIVPANITEKTNDEGETSYDWERFDYPLTSKLTDEEFLSDANKQYAASNKDTLLGQGCPTSLGFTIDCMPNNVSDFSQTLSLLSIYPVMTEVVVRDYDNINHTITVEQYQQMCIELGAHVMATRQAYWADIDVI